MKRTMNLSCGCKQLKTDNLEEASAWILDSIAGLRAFQVKIEIHSDDLGCVLPHWPLTFPPDGPDEEAGR